MQTEFTTQSDDIIVEMLANNRYDLKQRTNEELMYCVTLITLHLNVFKDMVAGEDLRGDIQYVDGTEFKSDEQDLLISANLAQMLKPSLDTIMNELQLRATNDSVFKATASAMYKDSVFFYLRKQVILTGELQEEVTDAFDQFAQEYEMMTKECCGPIDKMLHRMMMTIE